MKYPDDHRRRNPDQWEQMTDTFTVIVKTDQDLKALNELTAPSNSDLKLPRTYRSSVFITTTDGPSKVSTRIDYQLNLKLVFDKRSPSEAGLTDPARYSAYRIKVLLAHSGFDIPVAQVTAEIIKTFRTHNLCCHYAYCPIGSQNTRYYLTNQVIVHLASARSSLANLKTQKSSPLYHLKSYNRQTHLFELPAEAHTEPVQFLKALTEQNNQIDYAEFNLISRYQDFAPDSIAQVHNPKSWQRDTIFTSKVPSNDLAPGPALERGIESVTIAVIDYCFNLDHPDLKNQPGSNDLKSFGDKSELNLDPFGKTILENHGTACAGLIAGKQNAVDKNIEGVASGWKLLPIAFPLQADDDMMWDIFDYAGQQADVISCSWGPPPVYAPMSKLMWDKFNEISDAGGQRNNGAVIVFAAGNFSAPLNAPNNHSFIWRDLNNNLRETRGPILNGEATHPAVVTVAACTSENEKATYSNWGQAVTLCAPSNNAHPISRHQDLPGKDVWTMRGQFTSTSNVEDLYTTDLGGTSVAAALVAGVAGLVFSVYPEIKGDDVKKLLKLTAEQIKSTEADLIFEDRKGIPATSDKPGMPDHCEWFGYGKVNATFAIKKAQAKVKVKSNPSIAT